MFLFAVIKKSSCCEGESDCFKEVFPQQCICRQYTGCKPEYAAIYNCTM